MSYSAPDYGGYTRSERDIQYEHSRNSLNNAYGRFVSQQRGNRQLGDMTRGFQRGYAPLKSQFGRRGLSNSGVQSGVQQQAMSNYIGDYGRSYGRAQGDLTQTLQQFDRNQMDFDAYRDNALMDLQTRKADEIANSAININLLKQLFGGL